MNTFLVSMVLIPVIIGIFKTGLLNYYKSIKSFFKLPQKGKYRIHTSPSTGTKTAIIIRKFILLNPLKRATWSDLNRGVWFDEIVFRGDRVLLYPRHWSLSHWGSDEVNRGGLPREATPEEVAKLKEDDIAYDDEEFML